LFSALEEGEWSASGPSDFPLGKEAPDTHQTNPRTSLDPIDKRKIFCPYQESNPDSSVSQAIAHFLHQLRYVNAIEHWIINMHKYLVLTRGRQLPVTPMYMYKLGQPDISNHTETAETHITMQRASTSTDQFATTITVNKNSNNSI
jgi:hypothetical protein